MKKRRQKPQDTSKYNSSTFEESQINEISMGFQEKQISQKNSNLKKECLDEQKNQDCSSDRRSCLESAKQKMALYFLHFLNFLQFDRAFTKEEFEALKSEHYIFKSKFPDNYYLSYEERAKTFGVTVDEMIKKKEEDEENKKKSLWTQIKKFVCCEGEDQAEEADQLITAASQTDFYYLTKARPTKTKNILQLTEEALIEKPHQHIKDIFEEDKHMVKEKNFQNTKNQLFFEQKDDYYLPFDQDSSFNKQTLSNSKQINIDTIKTVQKRQHKKKSNLQITQNNENQNNIEGETNKSPPNKRNKKTTEKVYIQRKSDDEQQENIEMEGKQHESQKQTKENDVKIDLALQKINQVSPRKSENQKDSQNFVEQKFVQQISEISQIDDRAKINRKESESTLANRGFDSLKNSFKLSKQNTESQDHSFDISFNNQSTQKIPPLNSSQLDVQDNKNVFEEQNIDSSYLPLDQSDIISVAQSEIQQVDKKVKKQNKRKNKRGNSIQNSRQDLQVIEFQMENLGDDLEDLQNQTVEEDFIKVQKSGQMERKQNYFASSNQLGRQAKKNSLKLDTFEGLDFTIKEGKEEEDHEKQQQNDISFDDFKSNGNLSERGEGKQFSKKKKTRNKKMFNLKEEEENVNEVVFFPENQQGDFNENTASKTISFDDSFSNATAEGSVVKKRRKNKRIKDLNAEKNDEVIVLEAEQMFEDINTNQKLQFQQKIDEVHQLKTSQGISGGISPVKAEKKKKRKAKLREQIEKREHQMSIVDLGEIN